MREKFLLILVFVGLLASCKKDDDSTSNDDKAYDRTEMLTHFADSLITAKYATAKITIESLPAYIEALELTTDATGIINCRNQFEEAYIHWQYIAHLEIGPAEDISMRGNVNVYPTDTAQVNKNIKSGTYNLGSAENTDAKGLPAISYLLYGTGNNAEEVADYFKNTPNALSYLKDITNDYLAKINTVYNNWENTYNQEFKSRKGTDAGSSTSTLYNALVLHTERYLRDGKIGIPAGKRTLGETLPEKTENYYSGKSMPLAITNFKAVYSFFSATEKVSFYHYLKALDARYNGELLADAVDAQFRTAIDKLEAIPDPLSSTVNTNKPVIDAAYAEIQKLIVILKTDVPSALGVLINYQDNDGD